MDVLNIFKKDPKFTKIVLGLILIIFVLSALTNTKDQQPQQQQQKKQPQPAQSAQTSPQPQPPAPAPEPAPQPAQSPSPAPQPSPPPPQPQPSLPSETLPSASQTKGMRLIAYKSLDRKEVIELTGQISVIEAVDNKYMKVSDGKAEGYVFLCPVRVKKKDEKITEAQRETEKKVKEKVKEQETDKKEKVEENTAVDIRSKVQRASIVCSHQTNKCILYTDTSSFKEGDVVNGYEIVNININGVELRKEGKRFFVEIR